MGRGDGRAAERRDLRGAFSGRLKREGCVLMVGRAYKLSKVEPWPYQPCLAPKTLISSKGGDTLVPH